MKKAQIRPLEGRHLTAVEKRALLAAIEYQRGSDPDTWGNQWLGFKRSPKRYAVTPHPQIPNRYAGMISENYTTDFGEKRNHKRTVLFETVNVKPLRKPE